MTVTHIVSFKFKEEVSKEEREKVYSEFLLLKGACKREDEETSYIIDIIGGKQNTSPEGMGKEFDQSFIVTFVDHADRDWYVHKDQTHDAFAKKIGTLVDDAFIFDFEH